MLSKRYNFSNRFLGFGFFILMLCLLGGPAQLFAQQRDLRADKTTAAPESSVTPVVVSGSPHCATLNANNAQFPLVTTDYELSVNTSAPSGNYPFTAGGVRGLVGPSDPANSVTITENAGTLNWTSTKGLTAVIVQASSNSNAYYYGPAAFQDTNLTTPGGQPINRVLFCYSQPATVTIIKEVQIFGGTASPDSFPFTATNLGPSNFSLVDNDVVGPDRLVQSSLYAFGKGGTNVNVTESLVPFWTLSNLACTETDTVPNQVEFPNTINFANRTVSIGLEEGESVTCTFSNTSLIPTAAQVEISGRVVNEAGTGIRGALLTLFNANALESRTVMTNPFGYYKFENVNAGDFYILSVRHKTYAFPDGQRSFTVNDSISDLDFIGIN